MIRRLVVVCSLFMFVSSGWGSEVSPGQFSFRWENERCWLEANQAPANEILKYVSEATGIPIALAPGQDVRVTLSLADRDLEKLVNSISAGSAITYLQDPATGACRIDKIRIASSVNSATKNEQLRELVVAQNRLDEKLSSKPAPPVRYTGIGARVTLNDDRQGLWLSPVTKNAPAAKAGISAGDLVLAIDGKSVREFGGLGDIVAAIQGPANTQVRLKLRKPDGTEVVKNVTREWLDYASTPQ